MKKNNSAIVGSKNGIIDINKLCGECNTKFDYRDKSSTWIICESCSQGYHGNHILEKGKSGFCPICYGPLLVNLDLYLYEITGIVSGRLQFQAKSEVVPI
ncbi:MAG: hypothetical protein GPJ54_18105 [Candidatus Heimdallarchaeota archaeon]|nr:hypothetical protein [Candidatus Heimdallarchaeota archaeon]